MLSVLVIAGLFLAGLGVTFTRGLKWAFPFVLLPGLILLGPAIPIEIKGLPDMTTAVAISYGCLLGWLLRPDKSLGLSFHAIDGLVITLIVCHAISNLTNLDLWEGISTSGNLLLDFFGPYLIARVAFADLEVRRASLKVLTWVLVGLLPFALYEWRISPNWLSRTLELVGLTDTSNGMVLYRFGFARTLLTFYQPIDTGNSMLLIIGLMFILLLTTGGSFRDFRTWGPLVLAVFIGWTSMSFTFFSAFMAALALLLIFRYARSATPMVATVALYAMLFFLGARMYNAPPVTDFGDMSAEASYQMRVIIVQATVPYLDDAGFFGMAKLPFIEELAAQSVDNAYIHFALIRGWLYLITFLCIPLVLAWNIQQAARKLPDARQVMPLYVGFATLLGVMVGMYTVWFGFTYAKLWMLVLGLSVSMCQYVTLGVPAQQPVTPQRGFEPLPGRPAQGRPALAG